MIGPVLIANRGEIAVRIARTVRALGLEPVAVFTAADAGAPHVDAGDARAAGRLLPRRRRASSRPPARRAPRAVHPGYGFLSRERGASRAPWRRPG